MREAAVIRAERATRAAVHALWVSVLPALLAALVVLYLVPPTGAGFAGALARLGRGFPVPFGVLVFLGFAGIARYWEGRWLGTERAPPPARGREVAMTMGGVALAIGVALGVRAKLVDSYRVLGGSMLPTLEPDDRIAGDKAYRAPPKRGEIAMFQSSAVRGLPSTPGLQLPDVWVKRVIGLPGDHVSMHGGVPVINGWPVPSCAAGEYLFVLPDGEGGALRGVVFVEFLEDRAYLTVRAVPMPAFEGDFEVPVGEVFVLGDNRTNSLDSRSFRQGAGGGVPLDALEARATRFLVGTHRSGDSDLTRLLKPVDGLEHLLHAEGFNARDLETGIARCLERRPVDTHVPAARPDGVPADTGS